MATPADVAAYNARRRSLHERGIATIPDRYGQGELDGETDPDILALRRLESPNAYDVATDELADWLAWQSGPEFKKGR